MKIKSIDSQHRRDFQATYGCEHCGHVTKGIGYDDTNFHNNVIPNMKCKACGKTANDLATKYPHGMYQGRGS